MANWVPLCLEAAACDPGGQHCVPPFSTCAPGLEQRNTLIHKSDVHSPIFAGAPRWMAWTSFVIAAVSSACAEVKKTSSSDYFPCPSICYGCFCFHQCAELRDPVLGSVIVYHFCACFACLACPMYLWCDGRETTTIQN